MTKPARSRRGRGMMSEASRPMADRQGAVAPRAEPSRLGAKRWVGGRRNARKQR